MSDKLWSNVLLVGESYESGGRERKFIFTFTSSSSSVQVHLSLIRDHWSESMNRIVKSHSWLWLSLLYIFLSFFFGTKVYIETTRRVAKSELVSWAGGGVVGRRKLNGLNSQLRELRQFRVLAKNFLRFIIAHERETHDEVNVQRAHSRSKCHDVTHNYSRHSTATYIHYRSRSTMLSPTSCCCAFDRLLVSDLDTHTHLLQAASGASWAKKKVIRNSCRVRAIFLAIISYGIRLLCVERSSIRVSQTELVIVVI